MNTNLDSIFNTPYTHFLTSVSMFKQLFAFFSTVKIAQIKENTLFKKVSELGQSFLSWNDATIVEAFLFGLNYLKEKKNALIIEGTVKYIINITYIKGIKYSIIAPLSWIHSSPFLKAAIDSRSSYFIFFDCLVVKNLILYDISFSTNNIKSMFFQMAEY